MKKAKTRKGTWLCHVSIIFGILLLAISSFAAANFLYPESSFVVGAVFFLLSIAFCDLLKHLEKPVAWGAYYVANSLAILMAIIFLIIGWSMPFLFMIGVVVVLFSDGYGKKTKNFEFTPHTCRVILWLLVGISIWSAPSLLSFASSDVFNPLSSRILMLEEAKKDCAEIPMKLKDDFYPPEDIDPDYIFPSQRIHTFAECVRHNAGVALLEAKEGANPSSFIRSLIILNFLSGFSLVGRGLARLKSSLGNVWRRWTAVVAS